MRPEAAAAFADELARTGNPTSSHGAGRAARHRLDEAREQIAAAVGADPHEVILTSGGTEADNLAVKGAWYAARDARGHAPGIPLVHSAVEHDAIREAATWLAAAEGADVRVAPVGIDARVDLDALVPLLAATGPGGAPALVSVMWANNEIGTLQPVDQVVAAVRAADATIPVHSDAVQAMGTCDIDFAASGLDALSLSGHKIGAPVGAGALIARRTFPLVPVEHGGGQERGVRSGTLAVAQARALAAALSATVAERAATRAHLAELRAHLLAGIAHLDAEGADLRPTAGPGARAGEDVLVTHIHLLHPGARSEALLMGLDAAGIDASSGSACHAGVEQPSGVLLAMGHDPETARCALRVTLGHTSTRADVDALLAALPRALEGARRAHPAARRAGRN